MKITRLETFVCHAYRTNWVFLKVHTDEGVHGLGEATLEYQEPSVIAACHELERYLIGRDPFAIEAIWHDTYRNSYWRGGPLMMSALSAADMALWDIKGKALNLPVWQLLGGRVRERAPCYANGWFAPAVKPDEFAAKAKLAIAAGFRGLKWDPFGSAYRTIDKPVLKQALRCVQAVVEAVGEDVDILIEGHGRFDLPTAVRIGRALSEFDITWFEEPIPPDHPDGLREVKERSGVPIAGGERLYNRWDFRDYLSRGCVDFIQPDVSHAGGISELRKIAAMAESYHIPFCFHNPSGPVANAATLQLAACTPNFFLLETMTTDVPWRREICDEHLDFSEGGLRIGDRPGLGIELDEEAIRAHPYEPRNLRHFSGQLTQIRPANAISYFQPSEKS